LAGCELRAAWVSLLEARTSVHTRPTGRQSCFTFSSLSTNKIIENIGGEMYHEKGKMEMFSKMNMG
jgi:hypothetical protein